MLREAETVLVIALTPRIPSRTKPGWRLILVQIATVTLNACQRGSHLVTALKSAIILFLCLLAACETLPIQESGLAPTSGISDQAGAARLRREAEVALENGSVSEAAGMFEQALQLGPGNPAANLGLVEARIAQGQDDAAKQLLNRIDPADVPELLARQAQARGILFLRAGSLREAQRALQSAVRQDAGLWRSWISLGRVYARMDRPAEARAAFIEAERRGPPGPDLLNDIGMSYLALRDPGRAISYLEQALQHDPGDARAQTNLRIARALQGNYDTAVSGVSSDDLADALSNAGYAAILNGDLGHADRLLRRALEVSPVHHVTASANLVLLASLRSDVGISRE